MAKIIFNESSGYQDARIGKFEAPIRAFMKNESDNLSKKEGYEGFLFNVIPSEHFAESYITSDEFKDFRATPEGATFPRDGYGETQKKILENIEFRLSNHITKKVLDDSQATALRFTAQEFAENFVRAYHRTRNRGMSLALANGENANVFIDPQGATLDLTTADQLPLFHNAHVWGKNAGTQSNNYYTTLASGTPVSSGNVLEFLDTLKVYGRNMISENGDPIGDIFDTIILPGNDPKLENAVRAAVGSQYKAGTELNDISVNYGTFNVIVLPLWQIDTTAKDHPILLMSSDGSKRMHGNILQERKGLEVENQRDFDTKNWQWTGYARYGLGFGTYKHILKLSILENGSSATHTNATQL